VPRGAAPAAPLPMGHPVPARQGGVHPPATPTRKWGVDMASRSTRQIRSALSVIKYTHTSKRRHGEPQRQLAWEAPAVPAKAQPRAPGAAVCSRGWIAAPPRVLLPRQAAAGGGAGEEAKGEEAQQQQQQQQQREKEAVPRPLSVALLVESIAKLGVARALVGSHFKVK
jgi:hypothetical protein